MCRAEQKGADAKQRGWMIDRQEGEIWGKGNWKIGSWDEKKGSWTGEQTQEKVTSYIEQVLSGEKRLRWKMAGLMVRKEEGPRSEGVTCIVDGRDNRTVGREEKSWGFTFFFLSFIFRLESAGLGVDCRRADRCEFLLPEYSLPSLTSTMTAW